MPESAEKGKRQSIAAVQMDWQNSSSDAIRKVLSVREAGVFFKPRRSGISSFRVDMPRAGNNETFNRNAIGVGVTVNPAFIGAYADGVAAKRRFQSLNSL